MLYLFSGEKKNVFGQNEINENENNHFTNKQKTNKSEFFSWSESNFLDQLLKLSAVDSHSPPPPPPSSPLMPFKIKTKQAKQQCAMYLNATRAFAMSLFLWFGLCKTRGGICKRWELEYRVRVPNKKQK